MESTFAPYAQKLRRQKRGGLIPANELDLAFLDFLTPAIAFVELTRQLSLRLAKAMSTPLPILSIFQLIRQRGNRWQKKRDELLAASRTW